MKVANLHVYGFFPMLTTACCWERKNVLTNKLFHVIIPTFIMFSKSRTVLKSSVFFSFDSGLHRGFFVTFTTIELKEPLLEVKNNGAFFDESCIIIIMHDRRLLL